MNVPIVVIAYNRIDSLKRLLNSLKLAYYDNFKVDLIISIDKSDNKDVYNYADAFEWKHGRKKVIMHKENLGLRKHVLTCGDFAFDYDGIIMLEDDLVVSKSFYRFSMQSIEYYKDDSNIGGISLYTYPISEFANHRRFIPLQDDSDVFFMNVPSSWGQIWTKDQWVLFREWYDKNEYEKKCYDNIVPSVALRWGESSWKKYFYMYIAEKKKYIVYPRIALSTNMADVGTHQTYSSSTSHQSILMNEFNRPYLFVKLENSDCVYDAFFENQSIKNFFELDEEILIDFYGIREFSKHNRFVLSTRKLNFKVIQQWGLSLKPYELNILYNIKGNELFLYDLSEVVNTTIEKKAAVNLIKYDLPGITKEKALKIVINEYQESIKRRVMGIFK